MTASLHLERVVIGAAVVLTAVLFSARLADPVNILKMTALVLCAITLLASCAVRAIRTRVLHLPWGLPAWVALALLLAFTVAAVTAPVTSTAVLGAYGRNSGLLTYASALVLFLVGLRVFDRDGTRVVLYALMLAGGFTASYGLLQYVGLDAIPWANEFNPIIAAMGNPNFAAAYVAICSPAAAWGVLRTGWTVPWRIVSGLVLALCLAAAVLSNAAQGPLAAAPGLAVLAVAWLLDQRAQVRRLGLLVVGSAVAGVLVVVALGLNGVGPGSGVLSDRGSLARGWYWRTAIDIWREHPVFGVGLDTFGPYWRMERSPEAVAALGPGQFTDAAHSVPLHLLATGGLVLALAYAAFVAVTAAALVSGLRGLAGKERLLLGGLGGSWVAYQVQSLVSIDQVPLVVTQYVLAAGIVVCAGWARLREVRLPGAAPAPAASSGRKQDAPAGKPRELAPADLVALGLVGVITLAAVWQTLDPLRANAAVVRGDQAAARGDAAAAMAAYDQATELVPGQPRYWQNKARLHQALGQPEQALEAMRQAVRADRLSLDAVRQAAALAEEQGQSEEAQRLRERAKELEPTEP